MKTVDTLIKNCTILQSNASGPFIILSKERKNHRSYCNIKFINTGYITSVLFDNALNGRVFDKTLKSIPSHDYDITRFLNYEKHIDQLLSLIHKHMMDRCYNTKSSKYKNYGALGVKVDNDWHQKQIFISQVKTLYGYEKYYHYPFLYELDKDFKQITVPIQNIV